MKLKVLVDNNTIIDSYFYGEPGVSYYIEDGDSKILFDVGYSDLFINNAKKMDVDIGDIDHIVISHGHNDHTGGLVPLMNFLGSSDQTKPVIIAHPEAFFHKECDGNPIGSKIGIDEVGYCFNLSLTREPLWITEKIVFLGEIDRQNSFENIDSIGQYRKGDRLYDDYLKDDSAIVYRSDKGLVIITGCSHSGICNIIEHAKKVCKEDKIAAVIGGFHLLNPSEEQLRGTLEYFAEEKIDLIYPCHCSGLKFKIELSKIANIEEVGVGLSLNYS